MTLSAENFRQVYIPPGFAHGFCVLSDQADVLYKCSEYYDPAIEMGVAYDDPDIGIAWPSLWGLKEPARCSVRRRRTAAASTAY